EPLAQRHRSTADYEGKEPTELATTTQAQQEHKKLADQWGNLPEKERSGQSWKDFVPGEYRAKLDTGAAPRSGSKTDPAESNKSYMAQPPPGGNPKPNAPPVAPALPVAERKIIRTGDIEFEIESFDSAQATVIKIIGAIKGGLIATVNSEKLA